MSMSMTKSVIMTTSANSIVARTLTCTGMPLRCAPKT